MGSYFFKDKDNPSYTGDDIPFYNIKKGDSLNVVINKIATKTTTARQEAINALRCFFECPPDEDPVVLLAQTLCDLKDQNFATSARLFGLGNNTTAFAAEVTDRSFSYSTQATPNGATFQYSLNDFVAGLPSGVTIVNTQVKVSGRGNPSVASSSQAAGGFSIPLNNLPATVEVTATVNTKGGNAVFTQRVAVPASTNIDNRKSLLVPRDVSSFNPNTTLSQKDYNEVLASNISNVQSQLQNLNRIPVPTTTIQFASDELPAIITGLIQEVENLKQQLANV